MRNHAVLPSSHHSISFTSEQATPDPPTSFHCGNHRSNPVQVDNIYLLARLKQLRVCHSDKDFKPPTCKDMKLYLLVLDTTMCSPACARSGLSSPSTIAFTRYFRKVACSCIPPHSIRSNHRDPSVPVAIATRVASPTFVCCPARAGTNPPS